MTEPPAGADAPVLMAARLGKRFATAGGMVTALDGIDLAVAAHTITGIVGPDGAGKTTLMRLACGLLRPDTGRLEVMGLDVAAQAAAVQARVRYMPQRFGLYEDLSVRENLDLYADLQGLPAGARDNRYAELTDLTGLAPFMRRLAGRLSGGMKQKLGLACALLAPPPLLLLDEPTVGVDPLSRRELWRIIRALVSDAGTTVMLSTAYLEEAEQCDRVVLLHAGRILAEGEPAALTRPLAGRVYSVAAGRERRALAGRLAAEAAVTDAVVQGDRVRVVLADGGADARQALPGGAEPATPRFEDRFVELLRDADDSTRPALPAGAAPDQTSPADRPPTIRVSGLEKHFGDFVAVRDLSFAVAAGEIFGLLGANGAGKSTTFRMLCGLLPPTRGSLQVVGHDLRTAAARARGRIGYVAQRFSLYANLSVQQNLEFFARAYGLRGRRRRERLTWALETFALQTYRDAESGGLPLGFRQRLAMAAALMHEPEVLFLDEPTSGVDPLARREFWAQINSLAAAGVTVLVTTHFMEEAEYCDRIAILVDGQLRALGTPAEVRRQAGRDGGPAPDIETAFINIVQAEAQAA